MPRVLLVYAHPDDEAIAVGGRLPLFADAKFVQVTDGAPADNNDGAQLVFTREAYGKVREAESAAAFCAGGLASPRWRCFGIADKQAAMRLGELVHRVADLIAAEQVEMVFTHPYEGGHADHDACAFAVHTAVRKMAAAGLQVPLIVESVFYQAASGTCQVGRFLPHAHAHKELVLELSDVEQRRKRAMFAAFPTQAGVLRDFSTAEERFRVAPRYDFTQPPHHGPAYYERFIDGMTAERFCALASEAMQQREALACR